LVRGSGIFAVAGENNSAGGRSVHFKLLPILVAGAAGAAMAFQGAINAALGKIVGILEATFVVHLVGLVFVAALLFVLQLGQGSLLKLGQAGWHLYLGGILGVAIIYGVARSIPEIGVAPATTAIIVVQLLTAAIIDHTGLFGLKQLSFAWYRAIGVLFMASGAFLLLKK
jgi:transporter family-2 protein